MIHYVVGDATEPLGSDWPRSDRYRIIAHVCNTFGGWGKGFVLAVSRRWPDPEAAYRAAHKQGWIMPADEPFELGAIQLVCVNPSTVVANMIAQVGYEEAVPLQYDALHTCLVKLARQARTYLKASALDASIHMPRIGCGLARGKWEKVEPILQETLAGLDVYVYDLPTESG